MRPEVGDILVDPNLPAQVAFGQKTFTVSEFKDLISLDDNKLALTRKSSISGNNIREETLEDKVSQTLESHEYSEHSRQMKINTKNSMVLQGAKFTPFLNKVINQTRSAKTIRENDEAQPNALLSNQRLKP